MGLGLVHQTSRRRGQILNNPSIFSALRKDRERTRGERCCGGDVVSGRGEGQALSRPPLHRALAVPFEQEKGKAGQMMKMTKRNEEERVDGQRVEEEVRVHGQNI